MRPRLLLISIVIAAVLVGACSGSSPAASSPGGADQSQPAATSVQPTDAGVQPTDAGAQPTDAGVQPTDAGVQPTPAGGGGGGDGGGANSLHWEVSGDTVNKSGDYPFIALASVFNLPANISLSFSDETSTNVFGILIVQDAFGFSFGTPDFTIPALPGACTTTNLHVDGTSASGSFDCKDVDVLLTNGGQGKAEVKGTFDAHK